MELYLIRHAEAASQGQGGVTEDADRPLTPKGEDQARKLGKGLEHEGFRPSIVVSSPLLRARQTADLIVGALKPPAPDVKINEDLAPDGKRRRLCRFLEGLGAEKIALVGHQPDLGELAGWLIGSRKVEIDIAKAGVACIVCEDTPSKGDGKLVWLVPPEWISE